MPRQKQIESRSDGNLVNAITGIGIAGRDKAIASSFQTSVALTQQELEAMYRTGLPRRIVNLPVLEMTREWFDVEGDPKGQVVGYLETLKAKQAIQDALTWGDLYGGSLVVMGLDDGMKDLAKPVNVERINGIAFLHVYDRWQVSWTDADLYADPAEEKYNQPEIYTVRPVGRVGAEFRVHESRTMKFLGAKVPASVQRQNQGWSDSVLQAPYDEIRNFISSHSNAANIIQELIIGVMTIKNLVSMLASKGGLEKVKARIDAIDYSKSVIRSVWLADGETFEKKTASITGLAEIIDKFAQALSAATEYGIPVSLLFGEQPSGLQATGEYAQTNWYDAVKCAQESKLQPELETLVRYAFLSKKGPTKGKEPKNWKIKFKPLVQKSDKDEADLRKTTAETDVSYIDAGVLTPEEVAISRFGGDRWSAETKIDKSLHEMPTAEEQAMKDAAAQAGLEALAKANGNGNGGMEPPPADDAPPAAA